MFYCSDVTQRVEVIDINDHAPQFVFDANASRYVAEINENSPASFILQLVATDEDSTSNGRITFGPSSGELSYVHSQPHKDHSTTTVCIILSKLIDIMKCFMQFAMIHNDPITV